ncbi:MAG: 6-carboxytetrahydropterin synthase QueD [Candidatus Omnitrophica bacterium]|nr:6-carboxytetrahydropterin synthase QueD [Candidatus Omnitrophota bacterium]
MYSIRVEGDFSSAHNLRGYKGKCEELHGHNWKVAVVVSKEKPDQTGMVMDFKCLKQVTNKLLDTLDHAYLNKIPYFRKVNPTSENIARYIYDRLKKKIPALSSVTVWESDTSSATYEEKKEK